MSGFKIDSEIDLIDAKLEIQRLKNLNYKINQMINLCEMAIEYDDYEKVVSFCINNQKHTASDIESFLAGLKAAHNDGVLHQFNIERKF